MESQFADSFHISPNQVQAQSDKSCPQKIIGDANCDGSINKLDYDIWLKQYDQMINPFPVNNNSNFMCVLQNSSTYFVDLTDYEIWRRNTFSGLK